MNTFVSRPTYDPVIKTCNPVITRDVPAKSMDYPVIISRDDPVTSMDDLDSGRYT